MHLTKSVSCLGALSVIPSLVSATGCPFNNAKREDAHIKRDTSTSSTFGTCATSSKVAGGGTRSSDWWPCLLRLDVLRQFGAASNPMGDEFSYVEAFNSLDCKW